MSALEERLVGGIAPYQVGEQRRKDKATLSNILAEAKWDLQKVNEHATRRSNGYADLGDTGSAAWYGKLADSSAAAMADLETALRRLAAAFGEES